MDRETGRSKRFVLLLRMLQDQQTDPIVEGNNLIANAQYGLLAAMRAFVGRLCRRSGRVVGHVQYPQGVAGDMTPTGQDMQRANVCALI